MHKINPFGKFVAQIRISQGEAKYFKTEKPPHTIILLELYFRSVGVAQLWDVNKLFHWGNMLTERTVKRLIEKGNIVEGVTRSDKKGEWLALVELGG